MAIEVSNIDDKVIYEGELDSKFVEFIRMIAEENLDDPDKVENKYTGQFFKINNIVDALVYLFEYTELNLKIK